MHNQPESGKIFLVKTTPGNQALKDAYRDKFVERTTRIREDSGFSRADIAASLGISADTYRKYEETVVMPHFLIPRFLAATRGDARYLFGLSKSNKRANLSLVE